MKIHSAPVFLIASAQAIKFSIGQHLAKDPLPGAMIANLVSDIPSCSSKIVACILSLCETVISLSDKFICVASSHGISRHISLI